MQKSLNMIKTMVLYMLEWSGQKFRAT